MKILVTGAAGFIGFHSSVRLLSQGHEIVGIDNLNGYYDVSLKTARLAKLEAIDGFKFIKMDLADRGAVEDLFNKQSFDAVLHLGAQAGVRYSIDNPFAYIDSNLTGTLTILEGCRHNGVRYLVYASSSSVYGANTKQPFSVEDRVDHPVSLYAATKKANELMCQTYAHLYGMHITGMRFFTVYGPWGRPDMAYFKFANAIVNGKPIDVYNNGEMKRDFTYIDDIVDGISEMLNKPIEFKNGEVSHRVYNLGNNQPEKLMDLIRYLESSLGAVAEKNYLPMQPGDVHETYAEISQTRKDFSFEPKVSLKEGIERFSKWYREFNK